MRSITKNLLLSAMLLSFSVVQAQASTITTGDTGLGNGLGGAVIGGASGGYVNTDVGKNSATLNFKGDSLVNWNSLNVNKGETLNFNAVNGANGLTVVNSVSGGMSQIYGNINSNSGISNLIISNPNGMLYDGAKFTTAGDLMLTTQALGADYINGKINVKGLEQEAVNGITIQNSDFSIGGEFNITAPSVDAIQSTVTANKGFKLITADGQNYLVAPTTNNTVDHVAVRLKSVSVNGDVYIASGKDIVSIVDGGTINGNLNVDSDGNVALNYVNDGQKLTITGDANVKNDGHMSFLHNAEVGKNLDMSNSGGYVEVKDIHVKGDANITTTMGSNLNKKHYVHVYGDNTIDGNMTVNAAHNIHIGGYDKDLQTKLDGSLKVGKTLTAIAKEGSVAVTVDTSADKVRMGSGTLNIISDGKAKITANDYKFVAAGYIGGLDSDQKIIDSMEGYKLIAPESKQFLNISGGTISQLKTGDNGYAFIHSDNDMMVTGVDANNVNLSSAKDIYILGNDVHANNIIVDGETRNLTVETPANSRDYTLTYTNIRDAKKIVFDKGTEITYDMANGEGGLNINKEGRPDETTYLVVKGSPTPGPDPKPDPKPDPQPTPPDNDPEKLLPVVHQDLVDAPAVYTPIAFAADLDDEFDTGVRKNVDGSVTVVEPFTPEK